jgi:hypothetical protein
VIHFVVLLVAGAYFRYICGMRTMAFVGATFLAAAAVTLMNNLLWPQLRLSRVVLIEAQRERDYI